MWPDGKKRPRNVYTPTEDECEEKLEEPIREMNAEIEALSDEVRAEFRKAGVVRENREDCATSKHSFPGLQSVDLLYYFLQKIFRSGDSIPFSMRKTWSYRANILGSDL